MLISLFILANDRGPVLFKQQRVGRGGKVFTLYKFRSMHVSGPEWDSSFEPGNTSRVTRVGKIIRKTKLDELPQLLNVIKGDMSLVGPRPEVRKWVDAFPQRWKTILTVRPGLTDVASLEFRNEEALLAESKDPEATYKDIILPRKLALYENYVLHHSFAGDLKLIFKTLFSILKSKAA
jgi:lipopolysaccharide/colanic/teichoic acid biosynthesis glycosyltransferase